LFQEKYMFTIADICSIAVQIEKNGEETYRKASLASKNFEVAQLLAAMAEDERQHGEWLATITSNNPLTEEHREMEAVGKTLLQDMVKGNPFLLSANELEGAEDVEKVLTRSIGFEEDTILFYQFISEFLDDQDAIRLMQTIITEERKHVRHLQLLEKTRQGQPQAASLC
jgi:rubrerythrin